MRESARTQSQRPSGHRRRVTGYASQAGVAYHSMPRSSASPAHHGMRHRVIHVPVPPRRRFYDRFKCCSSMEWVVSVHHCLSLRQHPPPRCANGRPHSIYDSTLHLLVIRFTAARLYLPAVLLATLSARPWLTMPNSYVVRGASHVSGWSLQQTHQKRSGVYERLTPKVTVAKTLVMYLLVATRLSTAARWPRPVAFRGRAHVR